MTVISKATYAKKFYIYQPRGTANGLGYGPNRMWEPPLKSSNTIISAYLRHFLNIFVGPFMFLHSLNRWFWSLATQPFDGWDFVWYNNAEATGNQLYPRGVHLYYDFYSFAGLWNWFWDRFGSVSEGVR